MVSSFKALVSDMKMVLENEIINKSNQKLFDLFFTAYNNFCEEEKGGADYIFDLESQDDFSFLAGEGKINFSKIRNLEKDTRFVILKDDGTLIPVLLNGEIKNFIEFNAVEVLNDVLKYPYSTNYQALYEYLICALLEHDEAKEKSPKTIIGFTEYNNIHE